jgi:hypothetical protein
MLSKLKALLATTVLAHCPANYGISKAKSIARRNAWFATPLAVALILARTNAEATPRFARETGRTCNVCHSGPPRLNETGLAFKNDGFRFPNSNETPGKDHKDAPLQ